MFLDVAVKPGKTNRPAIAGTTNDDLSTPERIAYAGLEHPLARLSFEGVHYYKGTLELGTIEIDRAILLDRAGAEPVPAATRDAAEYGNDGEQGERPAKMPCDSHLQD